MTRSGQPTLREADIRPEKLLERYLELCRQDAVRSALRAAPSILNGQPFLEELMHKDDETLGAFQRFLPDNRLSSHCWVWAARSGTRGGDAQ